MLDAPAARRPAFVATAPEQDRPALALLYLIWVLVLFAPHLLLPGGGRILLALAVPALLVAIQKGRASDLYWPLVLFTILHLTAWPTSMNRGYVQMGFIRMAQICIFFTASVVLFKKPAQVLWVLKLLLLSCVWFGIQGIGLFGRGKINWHYTLSNTDTFGGLMAMAVGLGFCSLSGKDVRWRYVGYGTVGLGLLGVIVAFARGAVVAAAVVLFLWWLRSQHKLLKAAVAFGMAVLLIPAIEIVHPGGKFWREMKTIAAGTSQGTGEDRKILWNVAYKAFKESPIFGVGSWSTGLVASQVLEKGELEGRYSQPGRLYSRAIHNIYMQLLAEQGIVGAALWLAMLAGFLRRLHRLRSPEMVAAWNEATGRVFDLYHVALGLELGMVGYLIEGFFYNALYHHWFYTLILLALLLDRTAPPPPARAAAGPALPRAAKLGA